jgi:jumonji domain-containing protein 7
MRHVATNRPFVIRGGASSWKACKEWNSDYFEEIMGTHPVQVASTPAGNADSVLPLDGDGDKMIFVKPHESTEQFCSAMWEIQKQERNARKGSNPHATVHYLQTQNDNLRNECSPLEDDVPRDIPFARIALEKHPDAINFWLGNSLSTTALHKDNYENIYVQVLGQKHFVLLPPVEAPCVNERAILAATYWPEVLPSGSSCLGPDVRLHPHVDHPVTYTPFPTWDPDVPDQNATRFSSLSQPLRVTLNPGDMLYLPALWYHKVSQTCNDERLCCAVNYWYDLDFGGGFWSMSNFISGVGSLPDAEDESDREEKRRKVKRGVENQQGGTT